MEQYNDPKTNFHKQFSFLKRQIEYRKDFLWNHTPMAWLEKMTWNDIFLQDRIINDRYQKLDNLVMSYQRIYGNEETTLSQAGN